MCEICVGEAVEHLLVTCGKFERDQWELVDEVGKIVGAGEWLRNMEECKEGMFALLLGKGVEGVSDTDRGGGLDREVVDTAHVQLSYFII